MQNDERRTTIQIEVTRNEVSVDFAGFASPHIFLCVLDAILAGAVQWELDHEDDVAQALLAYIYSQTQQYHNSRGRTVVSHEVSPSKPRAN